MKNFYRKYSSKWRGDLSLAAAVLNCKAIFLLLVENETVSVLASGFADEQEHLNITISPEFSDLLIKSVQSNKSGLFSLNNVIEGASSFYISPFLYRGSHYVILAASEEVFCDSIAKSMIRLEHRIRLDVEIELTEATVGRDVEFIPDEFITQSAAWSYDPKTRLYNGTKGFFDIFGIENKPIDRDELFCFIHPEDRDISVGKIDAGFINKEVHQSFFYRLIAADGKIKYVNVNSINVFSENGELLRRFGSIQDVTSQQNDIEKLASAKNRLRKGQKLSQTGFWSYDVDKDELVWSDDLYDIYGVDKSIKVTSDFVSHLVHPDDREERNRKFELAISRNGPNTHYYNYRIVLKNGTVRWVEGFAEVHRDLEGNAKVLNGYGRDVSNLMLQKEIYDTSSSVGEIGVFDFNIMTGKLKGNRQWFISNDIPYEPGFIDFSKLEKKIHPEDLVRIGEVLSQCASGKLKRFSVDIRVRIQSGIYSWRRISAQLKEYLPQNNIVRLIGVVLDINELKESEQAAKLSEEKYKGIFESSPLPYQSLNPQGHFLDVNPAWLSQLGYKKEDVIGKWFGDFLVEEERDLFRDRFENFKKVGGVCSKNFNFRKADGNILTVSFDGNFAYDSSGKPLRSHCVFKDMTHEIESIKTIQLLSRFPSENPNPVLRIGPAGELLYNNDAAKVFLVEMNGKKVLNKGLKDEIIIKSCISDTGFFDWQIGETTYRISYVKVGLEDYINVYASDISDEIEARRGINEISRFPAENPNPVLRITPKCDLLYRNEPAAIFTSFIDRKDRLNADFRLLASNIPPNKRIGKFEFSANGKSYSISYANIFEQGYINLYVTDITEQKEAEEQRRRHAENLRVTLESIGDAVIATDTEGAVTLINPAAQFLTGFTDEEAIGKNVSEVFFIKNGKTGEPAENPVDKVLRTGKVVGLANKTLLVSKYGQEYQISDSGAPITDSHGRVIGVVLVFKDVTEQYAAQYAIEQSEKDLKRAQEIGNIGSWRFALNTSDVVVSEQTRQIYGLEEGHCYHIDEVQKIPLKKYRALLDNAIQDLISGKKAYDVEFEIKRPSDGEIVWVHSKAEYNKEENLIVGVLHDITQAKLAEEAIRQSEENLRITLNSIGDAVIATDTRGLITLINPVACRLMVVASDEVIGVHISKYFKIKNSITGKPVESPIDKVLTTGEIVGLANHTVLTATDGTEYQIADSGSPITKSDGEIVGVVLVFRDVTQEYAIQEKINTNERQMSSLLRAAPIGIGFMQERVINSVNRKICEISGYSSEELVGKIARIFYANDEDYEFVGREKYSQIEEEGTGTVETKWQRKDGKIIDVLLSSSMIDPDDISKGVTFTVIDITARKMVENSLRESEEKFRILASTTPSAVMLYQGDKWVYANEAASVISGYPVEEIIGREYWFFVHPDYQDSIRVKGIQRQKDSSIRKRYEFKIITKSGDERWVDLSGSSVMYNGKPAGIISVLDITERKHAELALVESERHFRQLFEAMDSGFALHQIICDENGKPCDYRFIQVNPAFEQMTGLCSQDVVGKTVLEILPNTESAWIERYGEVALTGKPCQFEHNSQELGKHFRVSAYCPEKGQFATTFQDISEAYALGQKIKESEAFLDNVLVSIQDGIIVLTPNLDIIYTNPMMEEWYSKYSPLKGKKCYACYQNLDKPCNSCPSLRALKSGNVEYEVVEGVCGKEGPDFVELFSYPMRDPETDEIIGVIEFVRDVTEKIKAEEEIQKLSEMLQRATKAGGVGLWEYDIETGKLDWYESMYALYGIYDRQEISKFEDWKGRLYPDDLEEANSAVERSLRTGDTFESDFRVIGDDGEVRWISARAEIVKDANGKPVLMTGTNWDITEIKKYQESLKEAVRVAQEANRAKSVFLANMSHEIRTPLNAIIGYGNIILGRKLDPITMRQMQSINVAGNTLLSLVNDVLDLSRIEADKLSIMKKPVNVSDMINDIEVIFDNKIKSKGLEFSIVSDLQVSSLVIDEARVKQILINLIGNAVKFTDQGSIELQMIARRSNKNKHVNLHISVADTGPGITEGDQKKIFNSFEQGDSGPTKRYQGSGLGLAISSRLAQLMGGKIKLESEFGKGSKFILELPCQEAMDVTQQTHALQEIEFTSCKVVVIDNDPMGLKMLNEQLGEYCLEAIGYDNGRDAIDYFQHHKAKLVLCDLRMGDMTGDGIAREISESKYGKNVPLVAVTADIFEKEHYDMSIFVDTIHKPIIKDELIRVLAKHLKYKVVKVKQEEVTVDNAEPFKLAGDVYDKFVARVGGLVDGLSSAGYAITPIHKLADELAKFASEYGLDELKRISNDLALAADAFDISMMDKGIAIVKELLKR